MPKHDGGPAFPYSWVNDGDMNNSAPDGAVVPPGGVRDLPGMSLRDYFAAAALQGLLASEAGGEVDYNPTNAAARAYLMADAMIAWGKK